MFFKGSGAVLPSRTETPRGVVRVFAMARPARSGLEAMLVRAAACEQGAACSVRKAAVQLAAAVAVLAIEDVRAAEDDLDSNLALALARFETPALFRLATEPCLDIAAVVRKQAVWQFEARGFRHLPEKEWRSADADLRNAVAARLVERFRKILK